QYLVSQEGRDFIRAHTHAREKTPELPSNRRQYGVVQEQLCDDISARRFPLPSVGPESSTSSCFTADQIELFEKLRRLRGRIQQIDRKDFVVLDGLFEAEAICPPDDSIGQQHPVDALIGSVVHGLLEMIILELRADGL